MSMFNFFKPKSNVLPKDFELGMMTSNFCTLKVGDKLVVPENAVCLVCYKDKIYAELNSGNYSVSRELFIDLYEKQLKTNNKLKNIKTDLYFANTKPFEVSFTYVDKIPLNNTNTKFLIDVNSKINVNNVKDFYKFVVFNNPNADAKHTQEMLITYIEESLKKFFLKVKLTTTALTSEEHNKIEEFMAKYLNKIGILLEKISIKLNVKTTIVIEEKKSSFFDNTLTENDKNIQNESTEKVNIVDSNEELVYTNQRTQSESKSQNTCSVCGGKLISGSAFCHRCGNKLQ